MSPSGSDARAAPKVHAATTTVSLTSQISSAPNYMPPPRSWPGSTVWQAATTKRCLRYQVSPTRAPALHLADYTAATRASQQGQPRQFPLRIAGKACPSHSPTYLSFKSMQENKEKSTEPTNGPGCGKHSGTGSTQGPLAATLWTTPQDARASLTHTSLRVAAAWVPPQPIGVQSPGEQHPPAEPATGAINK